MNVSCPKAKPLQAETLPLPGRAPAFLLLLGALTLTALPSQAQPYSFPFKGEDLKAGERIHAEPPHAAGIQGKGYDMGAFRHTGSDNWSRLKAGGDFKEPKDHIIYGEYDGEQGLPFYAMAAGEVIGCWRNSPNDPAAFLVPKVIGGGNHIWIRQDDGKIALYAHASSGSIPSEVCPFDEVYTVNDFANQPSNPDIFPEALVPRGVPISVATGTILPGGEVKRPRVKEGQFLGRVGYTGFTGGVPHIHIHMETGGSPSQPVTIQFRNGLTTPVTNKVDFNTMKADIDDLSPFPGGVIPDHNQFIWPARTLGKVYARHALPATAFQRLFDHLADSGYWLEWLDGYSVDGDPFVNFIWRPAQNAWRAYHLLTSSEYQNVFDLARRDGFQPHQVESSLVDGQPYYSAIFRKGMTGSYKARHGLTVQEHDAVFAEAKEQGLSPINDSVVSVGGRLFFTVLYRSDNIGSWLLKPIIAKSDYQALYDQNAGRGLKPFYVQSYKHGGKVYYSVIFSTKPAGWQTDRHGMSPSDYQLEFDLATGAGQLPRAVSGTDGAASNHEYIAIWRD